MLTSSVPVERTWHRSSARVMGSPGEILVDGPPELIQVGFARLRQLEQRWSRFIPDSELNRLQAWHGWLECSDDLIAALQMCVRMHEETAGLFDPSIRTSLEALGYDRTYIAIDPDSSLAAPPTHPAPGIAGLEIDGSKARIAEGWSIDLGGIGKGLAADIVADELIAAGANSAFVSLGGDSRASGEPVDADGWSVPLMDSLNGNVFAHHTLYAGALVMSATTQRRWRRDGVDLHHIIDPRTGRPAVTDLNAVAVADQSAARGEALAKCAIIAGRSVGSALLRSAGVKAWLVGADGVECIEGAQG